MKNQYLGLFRGVVTNNIDPQGLMRIHVSAPAVYGEQDPPWAMPCVPPGTTSVPEVGAQVWIEFEAGDPSRPVWMGTLGPVAGETI
jgi:hypothetical protein